MDGKLPRRCKCQDTTVEPTPADTRFRVDLPPGRTVPDYTKVPPCLGQCFRHQPVRSVVLSSSSFVHQTHQVP
jgi:hypothetical protein